MPTPPPSADDDVGRVTSIRGAVVDVVFAMGNLPAVEQALEVESAEGDLVRVEVQAHLDRTHIRAVALEPTGRLRRGDRARRTGGPLNTPVGDAVLGRLLTVTGETGDGKGPLPEETPRRPIHRPFRHAEPEQNYSKPASKRLICSHRSPKAARLLFLAGLVSARQFSLWS